MPGLAPNLQGLLTKLGEIEETQEEEKKEIDAMLGLVIFVVIGIVVAGLFVAWKYFFKSGTSADLEAQQEPGVQEKWKVAFNSLLVLQIVCEYAKLIWAHVWRKYHSEQSH